MKANQEDNSQGSKNINQWNIQFIVLYENKN